MSDFTHLKLWRLQSRLSQLQAARLLGLGEMTFSLIEAGRLRPSEGQCEKLRAYFKVEPDRLLRSVDGLEVGRVAR